MVQDLDNIVEAEICQASAEISFLSRDGPALFLLMVTRRLLAVPPIDGLLAATAASSRESTSGSRWLQ